MYNYFCAFCHKLTDWNNLGNGKSTCTVCNVVGSNDPKKCAGCRENKFIFYGEKLKNCFKCAEGFGPKSVTGLAVSKCIFCEDSLQTWYIFEAKAKMKCTNCEGIMPSRTPLVPEQCPECFEFVEAGLFSFKGDQKCLKCFSLDIKNKRLIQQNDAKV